MLGFAMLHDAVGSDVVGDCLGDEQHDPDSGDARQLTTKGELVWREASNTMAFTNGHQTWASGPAGLQQRLNTERFEWEPDAASFPRPGGSTAGGMGPFTGQLGRHGFSLTILPDGRGDAVWRIYRWCHETGGSEPCDRIANNLIIGGGQALMTFSPPGQGGSDTTTLRGRISHSTAPSQVPMGPVTLRLGLFGTGDFQAGAVVRTLCGPRFVEAPDGFKSTSPCGA